ncbi:DUF1499 domain-containing protein [Sulfitobacter donghicola]|nr:DUF1499 domain-containing protein [Sulfitobacter donghicola]KIN69421.1 DUF1499 domain containing protein [Sulfitobacter donghicola DSW-25 = KCTC 12864 = JCM 14565]
MFWLILVLAVVGLLGFIRFAPSDVARWHKPIGDAENVDGEGWSARVVAGSSGLLSDLHQGMLALPRTDLLAGSVTDGRLTYVTRSKIIGFPDYTTIEQDGDAIKLYARLRFGRKDFGVNGKRLDGLVKRTRAKRGEGEL